MLCMKIVKGSLCFSKVRKECLHIFIHFLNVLVYECTYEKTHCAHCQHISVTGVISLIANWGLGACQEIEQCTKTRSYQTQEKIF